MAKTMLTNLAAIAQNTQSENIRMIDIDELHDSPSNFFRMDNIEELADAILGQGGVKDNLVVTPMESGGYMIVSGHRRKAAVRLLLERGDQISRLLPCLVQHYDSQEALDLDLILLNVTARQLNDNELWQSYQRLDQYLKSRKAEGVKFGSMREELARQLHISRSQVSKLQHISSSAAPEVQAAVADGTISINTANEIAKLEPEQQQVLAEGDLRSVTPKTIRDTSEDDSSAAPKDLRWDGEILFETVKHQLMHLISEELHEAAISMNSVDFVNEFRRKCRTVYLSVDEGISIECGFDRITVSFSIPAEYRNIRSIWLAWRTAGKYVQTWIREAVPVARKAEKVDTPVTFSDKTVPAPPASVEPKAEKPVRSLVPSPDTIRYSTMPQYERDHIFDTGCFNEIALGYLTLALQAMGMEAETVLAAQNAMSSFFDQSDAAAARKAYKES